jgi:hypothetical protein
MRLLQGALRLITGATGVLLKYTSGSLQVRTLTDDAFVPVQSGKVTLPASSAAGGASLNIPHGTAPSAPVNGDMWTTSVAPYIRLSGTTRTIYHSGNLATVSQAEAEAGTATMVRAWTALRVAQAIDARVPTKLSDLENDIGAATHEVFTTTLDTTWSGSSAPFTKAQAVSGILATDTPIIDVVMSGTFATDEARQEAWGYIYRAVTSANTITFYATEKPTVSLPIQIKVVR